jgi:hypothetical protein
VPLFRHLLVSAMIRDILLPQIQHADVSCNSWHSHPKPASLDFTTTLLFEHYLSSPSIVGITNSSTVHPFLLPDNLHGSQDFLNILDNLIG